MRRSFRSLAFFCVAIVALGACGGGGGSSPAPAVPTLAPTPRPTATATLSPAGSAYTCPSSDGTSSVARSAGTSEVGRVLPAHAPLAPVTRARQIAVTYDRASFAGHRTQLATREAALGGTLAHEYTFAHIGVVTRLLSVPQAKLAATVASLRAQPGVKRVSLTGSVVYPLAVTTRNFPSEPYFNGFTTTLPPVAGATAPPATYHVAPYEESANVPGQWEMHAIGLDYAWAYALGGNGSGVTNANALGSPGIKIAVIDTGADTLHPKLRPKVVYQRCFVTSPGDAPVQSTSNYSTDEVGHGTDVTGIAGDSIDSGLGFVGAGGKSAIYSYRVFPTPDKTCSTDSGDAQCSADTVDIASAIEDAVAQRVNVISLSLGGGGCTKGQDTSLLGDAIADAVAANVVVVAAAGNDGKAALESPACDPGVIAVGASALGDGVVNGSHFSGGTSAAPVDYVASYSDYGTPAKSVRDPNAWGIVAPGGDPTDSAAGDPDDLHWIENIWTSTPLDTTFLAGCTVDYPGLVKSGPVDCRVKIAGTSMAAPIVAGSAALILAVNAAYQSPARMKQLLCSTADDIGAPHQGCGRLNIYRAMAKAVGDPRPPT